MCTTQNHSSILVPQPKNANQSTATSSSSDRAKSLIYCTRLQFGSVHYILIDFRTINNASAQPFPPHTPRRWEKQPTEADATDAGVCEWYFKHRSRAFARLFGWESLPVWCRIPGEGFPGHGTRLGLRALWATSRRRK